MKARNITAFIAGIVAIIGLVVHLTRYEYFSISPGDGVHLAMRTNRWTGETDLLNLKGWQVVQTPEEWSELHWIRTHSLPEPQPVPVK